MLGEFDEGSIKNQRALNSDFVLMRLNEVGINRITMDFDGWARYASKSSSERGD